MRTISLSAAILPHSKSRDFYNILWHLFPYSLVLHGSSPLPPAPAKKTKNQKTNPKSKDVP